MKVEEAKKLVEDCITRMGQSRTPDGFKQAAEIYERAESVVALAMVNGPAAQRFITEAFAPVCAELEKFRRQWAAKSPIVALRMRAGISQKCLVDMTGISQPNLSRIESGRSVPRGKTLEKIAKALGVSIPELIPVEIPEVTDESGCTEKAE